MSIAARLEIELDRPSRAYRSGEPITGNVVVRVREIVVPERLSIELRWRTHGRGKTAVGEGIKLKLLRRGQDHPAWEGGQTYRYPFEFSAPPWPPTRDGTLVSVAWKLTARGSVGWRRVEAAAEEIRIEPAPAEEAERPLKRGDAHEQMGSFITYGGIGLILGVGLFLGLGKIDGMGVAPFVCGGGVTLIGLGLLWLGVSNYLAEQRLGPVHAALTSRANPGGEVALELRFAPPQPLDLNEVTATLEGIEEATYDDGDATATDTEAVVSERTVIRGACRLRKHELIAETIRWRLPLDAPYSLDLDHNKIRWQVNVHIDVPNWPDWQLTLPFEVLPGRVGAPDLRLDMISITVSETQRCPYCHEGLAGSAPSDLQTCVGCRAVLHKDCLREYGSCTTRGCRNNRREVRRAQAR